jgi:hypothetical protein
MDLKNGHFYRLTGDSLAAQLGGAVKILENKGSHCIVQDSSGFEWLHPSGCLGEEVDPSVHFKNLAHVHVGFLDF